MPSSTPPRPPEPCRHTGCETAGLPSRGIPARPPRSVRWETATAWRPPLGSGGAVSGLSPPCLRRPADGPSLPCPGPPWDGPSQLWRSGAPRTLRLAAGTPRRSAPASVPRLPLAEALRAARALPGAPAGASPVAAAPRATAPGRRGAAAGAGSSRLVSCSPTSGVALPGRVGEGLRGCLKSRP